MKKIYITMVKLPTFINHYVYCLTGFKYTHFSVSFYEDLRTVYSFQIKNKRTTLVGGLLEENESFYFHGKPNTKIEEIKYEIPLSDEEYEKVYNFVENIKNDKEYTFNYISAWLMFPFGGVKSHKAFHCSEFICEILNLIDEIKLPKKTHKMHPKDLYKVLNKYKHTIRNIYSKDYIIDSDNVFFRKIKLKVVIKKSLYSIKESFCRAIFQRTTKNFDYHNINFYEEDCK